MLAASPSDANIDEDKSYKITEATVTSNSYPDLHGYCRQVLLSCLEDLATLTAGSTGGRFTEAASANGPFTAAGRSGGIGGKCMHVSPGLTRGHALKFRAARPQGSAHSGRWPSILMAASSRGAQS